ncbi:hypothetical protein KC322_g30 [Hortaea werneckii]|nr:hypothetical protein KC322_g30 [Hortaea werneckii]
MLVIHVTSATIQRESRALPTHLNHNLPLPIHPLQAHLPHFTLASRIQQKIDVLHHLAPTIYPHCAETLTIAVLYFPCAPETPASIPATYELAQKIPELQL